MGDADDMDEAENRARDAVAAAMEVYDGDRDWLAWADAWLSSHDKTVESALRAAARIPGTEESLELIIEGFETIAELSASDLPPSSEAYQGAIGRLLADYERRLPRSADLEAAVPRTAADAAFWSTLSALFATAGESENARTCAEASLKLCQLLEDQE